MPSPMAVARAVDPVEFGDVEANFAKTLEDFVLVRIFELPREQPASVPRGGNPLEKSPPNEVAAPGGSADGRAVARVEEALVDRVVAEAEDLEQLAAAFVGVEQRKRGPLHWGRMTPTPVHLALELPQGEVDAAASRRNRAALRLEPVRVGADREQDLGGHAPPKVQPNLAHSGRNRNRREGAR